MKTNDYETPEPESQENYEAAVLDFLDREIAAVQPNAKETEQSDELDTLVSDLLKQVISESDKTKSAQQAPSEALEDVLSEFPPQEEEVLFPPTEKSESSILSPPSPMEAEEGDSKEPTEAAVLVPSSSETKAAAFNLLKIFGSRMPMIAVASVCLLVLIGTAIYYFSRSPKSEPSTVESQPVAEAQAPSGNPGQDLPDSAPSAPTPAVQREMPPPVNKPSPLSSSSSQASAIPGQKVEAPKPAATPPPPKQEMAPGKTAPEPGRAAVAHNRAASVKSSEPVQEMSNTRETPIPTPKSSTPESSVIIVEPTESPISDNVALVISGPERRPPPLPASVPLSVEKPVPSPQSPAPAQARVAPRDLVPAVPISQVSPIYPELAIRARASGSVVLDLRIDKEGRVVLATPVSGPSVLYQAAIDAAMKWRYTPAMVGGTKVPSQSRVTMVFNLKD